MQAVVVGGGQSMGSDVTDELALGNSRLLVTVHTGVGGWSIGSAANNCDSQGGSKGLAVEDGVAVDTLGTPVDGGCRLGTGCRADDAEYNTWSLAGRSNIESDETARAEHECDIAHSGSEMSDERSGI